MTPSSIHLDSTMIPSSNQMPNLSAQQYTRNGIRRRLPGPRISLPLPHFVSFASHCRHIGIPPTQILAHNQLHRSMSVLLPSPNDPTVHLASEGLHWLPSSRAQSIANGHSSNNWPLTHPADPSIDSKDPMIQASNPRQLRRRRRSRTDKRAKISDKEQ
jgi:hypothetical protein